eukprot:TRINITY_DN2280_c0_g1_i2.p1 TRINITY_DN2280_c0_g1~~TRINITY_DN2280_c0_g1_i2.p1  ORF type:complete len:1351 (-),score=437.37 TRINITY_DN2280_c0_g1_i2:39-4091(-)
MASSELKANVTKVSINGKPQLGIGIVRFVGTTQFQSGIWVGVELDNPGGKNDGSVQDVRYFDCKPNHGLFVRENQVTPVKSAAPSTAEKKSLSPSTSSTTASSPVKSTPTKGATASSTKTNAASKVPTGASSTPSSKSSSPSVTPGHSRSGSVHHTGDATPVSPLSLTPSSSSSGLVSPPNSQLPSPRGNVGSVVPSSGSVSPRGNPTAESSERSLKIQEESLPEQTASPSASLSPSTPIASAAVPTSNAASTSTSSSPSPMMSPSPSMMSPSPSVQSAATTTTTGTPLSPSMGGDSQQQQQQQNPMKNESIEKLMRALKELNDFKIKAQETIRALQQRVKEVTQQNEKLTKESDSHRESTEKEIERLKKEGSKESTRIQKEWEKEKEMLEEQVNNLTENLEMVTLDRELAEQKAEELEQQLEQLRAKDTIREMSSKSPTTQEGTLSESSEESLESIRDQNEKLKDALIKLRDLSVSEKQEREKRIKELERDNKSLLSFQEKFQKTEGLLNDALEEIEQLKDAVDAAGQSEEMIEELTEKNLSLEEKIRELEATNEELEALRDISEELEESQNAMEKQLRSEIYGKEVELLDQAGNINNLKNRIADQDRTIEQFRNVVRSQQEQLHSLREREAEAMSQASEINEKSQALMTITHQLQTKVLKTAAIKIDQEIAGLSSSQAMMQVNFVKEFIPVSTFQSDFDCLSFLMLLKRISFKSKIIAKNCSHYRMQQQSEGGVEEYSEELLEYFWKLSHLVSTIELYCLDFEDQFNVSDTEQYFQLGKLYHEWNSEEKTFDQILSLIREEELGPKTFHLDPLKGFLLKLEHFGTVHLCQPTRSLERHVQDVMYQLNSLLLEERKLRNVLNKRIAVGDSSRGTVSEESAAGEKDQGNPLSPIQIKKIHHGLELCRKLIKSLQEYLPAGGDVESVQSKVDFVRQVTEKALEAFRSLSSEIQSNLSGTPSSLESSTPEFVFGVVRRILSSKVDLEWQWLNDIVISAFSNLSEVTDLMLRGISVPSIDPKDTSLSKRSSIVRSEINDSATMKTRLEEKTKEISEYRKQIQLRENDLQDAKFKEQALEKKIQRHQKTEEKLNLIQSEEQTKHKAQEKMFEEALDAFHKDIENERQENRALKEKLSELERNGGGILGGHPIGAGGEFVGAAAVPAEFVSAEIQSLRSAIRYLRSENTKLKGKELQRGLEISLPPIQLPHSYKSITNVASLSEDVGEDKRSTAAANTTDLSKYNRELTNLLKELQEKRVSVKVVDLNSTTSSSSQQLFTRKSEVEMIQSRVNQLREKLSSSSSVNLSNVAEIHRPAGTNELKILGRVKIPSSQPCSTRMTVDYQHFKQIHSVFV